jgi:hypothetical protein
MPRWAPAPSNDPAAPITHAPAIAQVMTLKRLLARNPLLPVRRNVSILLGAAVGVKPASRAVRTVGGSRRLRYPRTDKSTHQDAVHGSAKPASKHGRKAPCGTND